MKFDDSIVWNGGTPHTQPSSSLVSVVCALSVSLASSWPHLDLVTLSSLSLTSTVVILNLSRPHFVALSVSHLVHLLRSPSPSRVPAFGSSTAEADRTSQATADPSGGGCHHLVSRQSQCWNPSIRVVELEIIRNLELFLSLVNVAVIFGLSC
ncbi:uncharacterized protein DS421_19g665420 [Arachis hypogaea]|uniref:Uncharacterized protein n=1 Tax=Arachis hypogaea TaxID=3818 RepID=A0A6B9VBG2_ARAHY|nr:uncharacterized protein DS421_19g665420 [Arachis hypogaea]